MKVEPSLPNHAGDVHATHSGAVTDLISMRLGLIVTALVLLMVGVVLAVQSGGVLILAGAVLLLVLCVAGVIFMTNRLTGESEHVSPETAAALEDEGVGDPDALLTNLVVDFTPDPPHGDQNRAA